MSEPWQDVVWEKYHSPVREYKPNSAEKAAQTARIRLIEDALYLDSIKDTA